MIHREQTHSALSTQHLRTDLKGRALRGGFATITSQGSQFVITSVMTVVLARLLTPGDFGLVAMVTAVTGVAQAFADVGLSEATIQREEISHDQVSMLFWINAAIGVGLALATVGLGPVLARLDRQPQLIHIAFVMSFTFIICGLRVQPDAILKRQMRFRFLAVRDAVAAALGVATAIAMAWRGDGYWALVAFPLVSNFTQMALSWLVVNWRPSLPRLDAPVRDLVAFGGNVAVSYFMFTVNESVDKVLIGWYWGASPLGLYGRAYSLLTRPLRQINAPMSSVAIPAFSRLQGEPERYARYYLRAVNLSMWLCAPVFGFLFVAAEPVMLLVLGRQWLAAAPVFQMLAFSGLGVVFIQSTVWLFVSRGQSARMRKLMFVVSPITIASYAIGLPFGIKGVAISYSLALLAMLPWILKYAFQGTNLTLQRVRQAVMYPVSVGLLGAIFGELSLYVLGPQRMLTQFLAIIMGFGVALSLAAAVRGVRAEIRALRDLASELRFVRQAA